MEKYTYCITWGNTGFKSFVEAEDEEEAISEFIRDMKFNFGEQCEPDVKSVRFIG
jgi:hypothetical protein